MWPSRALATRPRIVIVLADEPTANLDHATGEGILTLMRQINHELKTTFIFSTHDKRVVAMADQLVRVEDGRVTAFGEQKAGQWSWRPVARST